MYDDGRIRDCRLPHDDSPPGPGTLVGGEGMREVAMPHIELSAGIIDYADTGGAGPVVVFTHGLPMSATQWRKVVPLLQGL